uniref:Uncharacterized protein n=1 Tax=Anguilla anguilla TaxID=7936 RepID=A0A0E9TIJ6_ANGAN
MNRKRNRLVILFVRPIKIKFCHSRLCY